jgi:succinate-acetate transporter protein
MEVPLLLFVLGVSIFLLAMNAWGMVPNEGYAPFALFTGGLGGLIVCVLAFRAGNPYGYVAAGAVGTFFASSAFYHWFFSSTASNPASTHGWIGLAWMVVFGFLALASLRAPDIPGPGKLMWVLLWVFFLFRWLYAMFNLDFALTVEAIAGILVAIMAVIGGYTMLGAGRA